MKIRRLKARTVRRMMRNNVWRTLAAISKSSRAILAEIDEFLLSEGLVTRDVARMQTLAAIEEARELGAAFRARTAPESE